MSGSPPSIALVDTNVPGLRALFAFRAGSDLRHVLEEAGVVSVPITAEPLSSRARLDLAGISVVPDSNHVEGVDCDELATCRIAVNHPQNVEELNYGDTRLRYLGLIRYS